MLAEIEQKAAERLKAKITEPARIKIEEGHQAMKTLSMPSIDVICAGGPFEKVGQKYMLNASLYVIVEFQNARSTEDLRKGIYPILEAVVACLQLQTLELPIKPLKPKRVENVTEKEEADNFKAVFQIEFEAAFIIEKLEETEIDDLLKIGLNYYLQPEHPTSGDKVDAVDIVTLAQGGQS